MKKVSRRGGWKKPYWWREANPKIRWRHDARTLEVLYNRYQHDLQRARILLCLKYLRADVSFERTAGLVGVTRKDVIEWAKQYDRNGLKILLAVSVSVPPHVRSRIEDYVRWQPSVVRVLQQLKTDDDFEFYGEEMDVDGDFLRQWIMDHDLEGHPPEPAKASKKRKR